MHFQFINKVRDPQLFINTVYNNFSYLKEPELNHTVEEIKRVMTCNDFFGILVYDTLNNINTSNVNKIIGYTVGEFKMLNDGRHIFYITYMFVAPKHRGKKIGSMMVDKLVNHCTNKKIHYVVLTCDSMQPKLVRFYNRLGFNEDPLLKSYSRHIIMSKIMSKQL